MHIGVDAQEGQADKDDTKQHHAHDDAADLTDTAHKGDAADDTRGDSVQLVVKTCGGAVGADSRCLDKSRDTVQNARQRKDQNDGSRHIHARHVGGFRIGAYGKHIFAEGGLVPYKPHDKRDDKGIQHVIGDRGRADSEETSRDEVGISRIKSRNGLSVVGALHEVDQQRTVGDQLGGKGDDKGVKVEFCRAKAVDEAHKSAYDYDDEKHQGERERSEGGEHFPRVAACLQKRGGHTRRDTHDTTCGKVGSRQNDTSRDA